MGVLVKLFCYSVARLSSLLKCNLKLFGHEEKDIGIIGSDLFFDPEVFEPLLITIAWLLEHNPKAEVLIAVQERSSDWCLEEHLLKWKLKCSYIYPKDFLQGTGLEETDLTGKHTIFILKIFPE